MTTMLIKRVGVISSAKISGLIGAGIGLLIGLIYGLIMMTVGAALMAQEGGPGAGFGVIGGLAVIIMAPIFYAVFAFVVGALYALIYNVAAGFVGGIELELESAVPAYGAPPPPPQQWPVPPPNSYQPGGQPPTSY